MKGFSTLSKHIFIYIAICVISFILVSTICYKADYKHIYNYYSDRLYLQANEIANEYALDYLAESKLRRIELEMKSLSTFNDTRIMFILLLVMLFLILTTVPRTRVMRTGFYSQSMILTMVTSKENTIFYGIFTDCFPNLH